MQIPTWLGYVFKSGEVSVFTGGVKTLQLKAENKKIDLNVIDKELLQVLRNGVGKSFLEMLTQLKNIAEELKDNGLTITISYKDGIVLTLGSGANPKLSWLITRTNAIEINDLSKLLQIGI